MTKPEPHAILAYGSGERPDTADLDMGILDDFIGMHLRLAQEAAYADFVDRLGEDALRPGYFTILTLVARNPRISQTQIGLASGRDKSSVTNALRWMEDQGLVVRLRAAQDRRTHLSVATEAGIALQSRMEAKAAAHVRALDDAIGAEKRAEFVAMLKQMVANLGNRDNRA